MWSAGVTALLVALPPAARHRLPPQAATHWDGRAPDASMPPAAAALFPAAVWLVLVLGPPLRHLSRPGPTRPPA
ncbi:hypothetical protein VM98_37595, partial [Streptomyces rubellomurinus subsp. indigoferus]